MFENERYGLKFFPLIQHQRIDLDSLIDRLTKISGIRIMDSYKPLFTIIEIVNWNVECKIRYDGSITIYFNNLRDLDNMLKISNSVICYLRKECVISGDLLNSSQFIYHGSDERIDDILGYISHKLNKIFKIKIHKNNIYVRKGCLLVPDIPT